MYSTVSNRVLEFSITVINRDKIQTIHLSLIAVQAGRLESV